MSYPRIRWQNILVLGGIVLAIIIVPRIISIIGAFVSDTMELLRMTLDMLLDGRSKNESGLILLGFFGVLFVFISKLISILISEVKGDKDVER